MRPFLTFVLIFTLIFVSCGGPPADGGPQDINGLKVSFVDTILENAGINPVEGCVLTSTQYRGGYGHDNFYLVLLKVVNTSNTVREIVINPDDAYITDDLKNKRYVLCLLPYRPKVKAAVKIDFNAPNGVLKSITGVYTVEGSKPVEVMTVPSGPDKAAWTIKFQGGSENYLSFRYVVDADAVKLHSRINFGGGINPVFIPAVR